MMVSVSVMFTLDYVRLPPFVGASELFHTLLVESEVCIHVFSATVDIPRGLMLTVGHGYKITGILSESWLLEVLLQGTMIESPLQGCRNCIPDSRFWVPLHHRFGIGLVP